MVPVPINAEAPNIIRGGICKGGDESKPLGDQPPGLIGERLFQDLMLQMVILK